MKKLQRIFVLAEIVFWIIAFILVWWILWSENVANSTFVSLSLIISLLPIFYFHHFIFTRYLSEGKFSHYSIGLVLLWGISPFTMEIFFSVAELPHPEITKFYSLISGYSTYLPFVIIPATISALIKIAEAWIIRQLKYKEFENQKIKAELNYLKAQINPHFLFNTLNNIHTLAYIKSPLTAESIMRLSSLMRYMIYDSNTRLIELKKEIEYIEDFIALQQLRISHKPVCKFNVHGDILNFKIPPLILIPLVENAYKHSGSALKQNSIIIDLSLEGHRIIFKISNPFLNKQEEENEKGGFGLENLKKRLNIIYPQDYTLSIKKNSVFEVVLSIPKS